MSTEMTNTLSVKEGLIRIENAERFQSKPQAAEHAHVVVMQKSGKSLRHYITLRNSTDRLSIGEQFWGNYVCYIVDMRSRNTKIAQEFVTRDHITKVHVTVDIAYKAVDGEHVAIGVDDALLTLRDELTNYIKREVGRLTYDQVTEDYLDGRIYDEGMRLQNWTGLNVYKITVALEWPKEIVDQIKENKEKRRKMAEEDEKRRRDDAIQLERRLHNQRLQKDDIDHIDALIEKLGLSAMPIDVKMKLMAMDDPKKAYREVAEFVEEARKTYLSFNSDRDQKEYDMLLKMLRDGFLKDVDIDGWRKDFLDRMISERKRDQDIGLSRSDLYGTRKNDNKNLGPSERPKQISRPVDDTEED